MSRETSDLKGDTGISIVIPAYKGRFLRRALKSIAGQEDKDFVVYVGDDCSPEDIGSIVEEFRKDICIRYVRFNDNLGRKDLLSQWERCISLVEEDYILFFSDDDILPADAISRVRKAIEEHPGHGFFRFPLEVIDAEDNVMHKNPDFRKVMTSAEELLCDKLSGKTSSAACEYVFSKALYSKIGGGFVHFPCAWCSDDATWYLMARQNGVVNIPGRAVGWRNVAGENISNRNTLNREKMQATIMFINWLDKNYTGRRDTHFIGSLKIYAKTIIHISLGNDFTFRESLMMAKALAKFSWITALSILLSMSVCILRKTSVK